MVGIGGSLINKKQKPEVELRISDEELASRDEIFF
jgi:hypothetical protein